METFIVCYFVQFLGSEGVSKTFDISLTACVAFESYCKANQQDSMKICFCVAST